MPDQNIGSGFIQGLAGAVKSEQRDINTLPMAHWEDVGRIRAQTFNLAGLRFWQLLTLSVTGVMWAYAWFKYGEPEAVVLHNPLTQVMGIGLAGLVLLFAADVCYNLYRAELEQELLLVICLLVFLGAFIVISQLVPVAVWVMLNMIAIGYAPITQMIACGWIPFILALIALSIVPDFQIGRFAFRHELVNQPEASSEKTVIDETAIRLKEMDHEHEIEKWERSNNVVLQLEEAQAEIQRLAAQVSQLQSLPPATRFVPMNHSTARAAYGNVVFSAIPQGDKLSDQAALWKFVAEFETRGTARDKWTGTEEQQRAQTHISQPQWEKITRALKNLKILDANNSPLVTSEEARNMLQHPPTLSPNTVGG